MNHFNLSNYYKLLRQQAMLLCSIAAICLLSSSTVVATSQLSSAEVQSIQVFVGDTDLARFQAPQGKIIAIPVTMQYSSNAVVLGAISVKISYDPTYLQPVGCLNESEKESYIAFCNYTKQPGIILLNALDLSGLDQEVPLALLEFHALGSVGSEANLAMEVKHTSNLNGNELPYIGQGGVVEIVDASVSGCTAANTCAKYDIYLPIVQ